MKLSEMKKKSGEYYSIDDVLGEEITIIEDVNQSTDFRVAQTKKEDVNYICLLIRHTEEKDAHLTMSCMRALSEAMPQNPAESWCGYRVLINRLGSGVKMSYKIAVVGKTIDAPRAPHAPAPKATPAPAQAPIVDSAAQVVGLLKHAPAGMEDAAFWKDVIAICGSMPAAMVVVEKLRTEGKIINLGGYWGAT